MAIRSRGAAARSPRVEPTLESADLRHADGYAVRLKGVTTQLPTKPAGRSAPKR